MLFDKPEEIRLLVMKSYELVVQALADAADARKEIINAVNLARQESVKAANETTKNAVKAEQRLSQSRENLLKKASKEREALLAQIAEQKLEIITREFKIRSQKYELLATAGAAYARGVIETMKHHARQTIEGLGTEKNRRKVWASILASPLQTELADCLWRTCRWSQGEKGRVGGDDAAKQIDSLYTYLCSNEHFADIAQVPNSPTTGIVIPKGVGALEGTYSKAIVCLLDSFPLDWTMLDSNFAVTDSSSRRKEKKKKKAPVSR